MQLTAPDPTIACAHCKEPLPFNDGTVKAWRSPSGQFFCNEWCAEDCEETAWQNRRGIR